MSLCGFEYSCMAPDTYQVPENPGKEWEHPPEGYNEFTVTQEWEDVDGVWCGDHYVRRGLDRGRYWVCGDPAPKEELMARYIRLNSR